MIYWVRCGANKNSDKLRAQPDLCENDLLGFAKTAQSNLRELAFY